MSTFTYQPLFELGPDETPYRKLPIDGVSTVTLDGQEYLRVDPAVLRELSSQAFDDIAHLLRPSHLAQLRKVFDDPESSANDRFVAMELLRNANIAAGRVVAGVSGHRHRHRDGAQRRAGADGERRRESPIGRRL